MDYKYEQNLIDRGYKFVCGIDEAGRGPLAGPLISAAVILDPEKIDSFEIVKDSKMLSAKKRDEAFEIILANAKSWAIGVVSSDELDKHGLAFANKIAMKRAWKHLQIKPDYILSDYMARVYFETPFELIKSGDKKIISVAAASIIAKVFRDRMMCAFDIKYPGYGFEQHKGYGTKFHIERITQYGPCEIHRKTFEPMKAKLF